MFEPNLLLYIIYLKVDRWSKGEIIDKAWKLEVISSNCLSENRLAIIET